MTLKNIEKKILMEKNWIKFFFVEFEWNLWWIFVPEEEKWNNSSNY